MASITKRGDSYRITVSLGYDVYDRKIRQSTTFTPDKNLTPKQEKKALDSFVYEFEKKVRDGNFLPGERITLKDYSEKWLAEYARLQLEPHTYECYIFEIQNKILPALGHLKLAEIKPIHIQSFYNNLLEDGVRQDGKKGGYSSASIKKIHCILSIMLKTAVKWQITDRNPCERVTLPKQPHISDTIKYFTPEQTIHFLDMLDKDLIYTYKAHNRIDDTGKPYFVEEYTEHRKIPIQFKVFFNLAIFGGCRNGELLALTWDDVDFENNTISITKAISTVKGKRIVKAPKTRTSVRTISFPSTVMKLVKQHKIEQTALILKLGDYWHNENLLFTQDNGNGMYHQTPYNKFKQLLSYYNEYIEKKEDDKLPNITLHGLRHTSATLLISEKIDIRTVSARLGHSQTSTTLDIYAHALKENDKIASDKLENLLQKNA